MYIEQILHSSFYDFVEFISQEYDAVGCSRLDRSLLFIFYFSAE